MDQDQMLKGKRIIITGASSGIGKWLAKGLAEIGAKIGILSRSEGPLKEIVREIEDRGHEAVFALGDVQQSSQVQNGVTSLVMQLGGVDVLINNAGVMELNAIPKDYGEIDRILDTNLKGSLYCTLAVLPYFSAQKSGAIINTSSVLSLEQVASYMPYSVIYAVSKAGINMFTRASAQRFSADGVQMNAILPGFVKTPLIAGIPSQVITQYGAMDPEELVPYYAFFAANQDRRITGRLIPVEIFNSASHFAKKIFDGRVPNWEELKPHLEKRYTDPKYNVYGEAIQMFQENQKLLLTLIGWNPHPEKQVEVIQ